MEFYLWFSCCTLVSLFKNEVKCLTFQQFYMFGKYRLSAGKLFSDTLESGRLCC